MRFKEDDRVIIPSGETGRIAKAFYMVDPAVYIVDLDDGTTVKRYESDLILAPTPEKVEETPVDDSKRISYKDYIFALFNTIMSIDSENDEILLTLIAKVTDALFADDNSFRESVELTKERFVDIIIDETRPSVVRSYLGEDAKIEDVISLSFNVGLVLMDVVPLLFGETK